MTFEKKNQAGWKQKLVHAYLYFVCNKRAWILFLQRLDTDDQLATGKGSIERPHYRVREGESIPLHCQVLAYARVRTTGPLT